MREDHEVANRVRRLRESQAKLVEAFSGMMDHGQPAQIDHSIRREIAESHVGPGLSFKMVAITGSALVLFGIILGRVTAHPTAQAPRKAVERLEGVQTGGGWQGDIAKLHSFFSRDTLSAKSDAQSNIEAARFQLANLVKAQIPVPDFSKHGMTFNRAQAFNYQGGRLMQLVYLGKEEPPVALYVMAGGPDAPMNDATYGPTRVVSWAANGAKLVLAGELPPEALKALAVVAQTQLAPK
jgi:anti-sigma factor RsiW